MEIPDTVQGLLDANRCDFTKALELVSKVSYNEMSRRPGLPTGLFGDAIRRELHQFGLEVGVDRSRELLKEAATQQRELHKTLSEVCQLIVDDLSGNEPGSFPPVAADPVK
jgi:hypothetical protein